MVPSSPADVNARCVDAFSCVFLGTIRNAIMAQRCEFREVKTLFYGSAQRMNKISFLTRENKIHTFKLRYNFLFIKKTKSTNFVKVKRNNCAKAGNCVTENTPLTATDELSYEFYKR